MRISSCRPAQNSPSSRCTAPSAKTARCRTSSTRAAFPSPVPTPTPAASPSTRKRPRKNSCRRCPDAAGTASPPRTTRQRRPGNHGSAARLYQAEQPGLQRRLARRTHAPGSRRGHRGRVEVRFLRSRRATHQRPRTDRRSPRHASAPGHRNPSARRLLRLHQQVHQGQNEYFCPAQIPEEIASQIQRYALAAHRAVGNTVYSRIDFLLEGDKPIVSRSTPFRHDRDQPASQGPPRPSGITFPEQCRRIVDLSWTARQKERSA